MSPPRSLAEEKEELLARMQASRVAYRRMLIGADTQQLATVDNITPQDAFPRSKTVRWIRDHPYLILLGLATAIVASRPAPRLAVRSAFYKGKEVGSALGRNQNRIRIALGVATAVVRFIERRRHH